MKTKSILFLIFTSLALPLDAKEKAPIKAASPASNVIISPDDAEKVIKENNEVTILDLRTEMEFNGGHIAGAKNLDFLSGDFKKEIAKLDKSKTYIIHCASGGRSTNALAAFEEQKFQSILHLKSGFSGWKSAGKPTVK